MEEILLRWKYNALEKNAHGVAPGAHKISRKRPRRLDSYQESVKVHALTKRSSKPNGLILRQMLKYHTSQVATR